MKDESGNALQNVTILSLRTGYVYKSGSQGSFGILLNHQLDTFDFSLEGYKPQRVVADAGRYLNVKMKVLPTAFSNLHRYKLLSMIRNMQKDDQKLWFNGDETYASTIENRFVSAKRYPNAGVSLNVDRASYSNIRRFISLNAAVPADAVRIEEMINYFNLAYVEPPPREMFSIQSTLTTCPWNSGSRLFYVQMFSKKIRLDTLPPANLVFLIDVSGSMEMTNRLPLLKSAFRMLVTNLRAKDSVAIVVYGGTTGIMLNTTSGADKDTIMHTIERLTPGGSTPGESGIRLAYDVAKRHFIKGGSNRVILATDGDFNVGIKTEEELDEMITRERETGIYLTCLGVGMGNYKDSKIQTLARKGNGNFAYIDNFREAEKVLMQEFTGTLYAVADDVFMDVEFDPRYVREYRLMGYDNKVGAISDSLSVMEGGEVGSAQSLISIFELIPEQPEKDPTLGLPEGRFADIRLDYKHSNDSTNCHYVYSTKWNVEPFDRIDPALRFSASVVMFGSYLKGSPFTKNLTWTDIVNWAAATADPNDLLQKEFVGLVQQARVLYAKFKKRKKDRDE